MTLRRYTLEHEDLPEMKLHLEFDEQDDGEPSIVHQFHPIRGNVDERLYEIKKLIDALEGFRKECWRYIDRQKNAELIKPYVKEIERLTEENEQLNDENERIIKHMDV